MTPVRCTKEGSQNGQNKLTSCVAVLQHAPVSCSAAWYATRCRTVVTDRRYWLSFPLNWQPTGWSQTYACLVVALLANMRRCFQRTQSKLSPLSEVKNLSLDGVWQPLWPTDNVENKVQNERFRHFCYCLSIRSGIPVFIFDVMLNAGTGGRR